MPQCVNCKSFLPLNFFLDTSGIKKCVFCERMTDTIYYSDFNSKFVTKKEIEEEYKMLIDELRERPNVDSLIKTADELKKGDIIKVDE